MEISVSRLKTITEKLFSHLENLGFETIEVTEDYYWNIPQEEKYVMEKNPENLDIGQLTDDWDLLRKLLENDRDPISYEFVWLAKIFEFIGEKVVH